jgi:hypothetical protein
MRWPELISLSLDSTTHCALSAATAHYIRSQIALSFCHATRHTPLLLYLLYFYHAWCPPLTIILSKVLI